MLQLGSASNAPPKTTRTRRRKADPQVALEHKRQLHRVLVKKAYYQQAVRAPLVLPSGFSASHDHPSLSCDGRTR